MAAIQENTGPLRKRAGVRKMAHRIIRIDMTPMVDLGFLLITFFVMTAEMSKPSSMNLVMPKDVPADKGMPVKESTALTILIAGNGQLFYYPGRWEDAIKSQKIYNSHISGTTTIRNYIREKQQYLETNPVSANGKKDLMIVIKPTADADYRSVINTLDEMLINGVVRYTVSKPEKPELDYITTR